MYHVVSELGSAKLGCKHEWEQELVYVYPKLVLPTDRQEISTYIGMTFLKSNCARFPFCVVSYEAIAGSPA